MKNVSKLFYSFVLVFALLASCSDQVDTDAVGKNDLSVQSKSLDGSSASSKNMQQTFTAHLTGSQEVPPVSTSGSGQAIFKLSKDGMSLHYKVIVNNIEGITQAHIHCGNVGVNGPVVAFLFGFVAEGVTKNGVLAEGTITAANVISRPDSQACMGGVASFEQLIAKIKDGSAYINVHTLANPPGEIRGQIK